MAQTVSDEELASKRTRVEKLRDQLATEQSKAATRVAEQENAIEAARLDAEAARLELQLQQAKDAAKVSNVKEGVAPVLASAKEQMELAQRQLDAAKGEGETPGAPKDPSPEEVEQQQKAADDNDNKDKE